MSWLIFGAGAIGTYVGGNLILHGQKVVFLEQSSAAQQILEHGLQLNIRGQENRILHPDIVTTLPDALSNTTFDVAIFALKSYDTQAALDNMRPFSDKLPPVLCLQNGVENEPAIGALLGEDKVIAGTVTSSIRRRGAGDILIERQRGIGIAEGHPLSLKLIQVLTGSGLNAWLLPAAPAMKWSKMLTNLMANASSAILDMTPAEILHHPNLYAVEIMQLREAISVMKACHIQIVDLPNTPVRVFAWLAKNVPLWFSRPLLSRIACQGRGMKMPSFHIDLHSGRGKSEVDYLNGAVVRRGVQSNIPTPVNYWLNNTLLSLTQGSLSLESYSHQPERYLVDLNSFIHDTQGND